MENLNQQIEEYLLNKMNQRSRLEFEALMDSDKKLADDVKLQQIAYDMLQSMGDQRLKTQLDRIHQNVVDSTIPPKRFRLFNFIIPIIVFLLFGILLYFFYLKPKPPAITPQRIYAEYYSTYELSFAQRSDNNNFELQQANTFYRNAQYDQALPVIENLLIDLKDTKLQMAAGICALQTNDYQKALGYFDNLIIQKDPLFQSQAKWYAALTALKKEEPKLAKTYLQSLIQSNATFKIQESKELIKLLK